MTLKDPKARRITEQNENIDVAHALIEAKDDRAVAILGKILRGEIGESGMVYSRSGPFFSRERMKAAGLLDLPSVARPLIQLILSETHYSYLERGLRKELCGCYDSAKRRLNRWDN
ncbi:MAG TPA: hypothetical protein VEW05_05910 [Candidatus Polarisedimenticolia bacterium]|nr:hypothetical protein [Candidatus Polarisedimenticolia bacterium]